MDFPSYVPVLIAGGGPVGLALGHALKRFGIPFLLVERNHATTKYPKMDLTNARTMELFRRIGVDHLVNENAVPPGNPFQVIQCTSFSPRARALNSFVYPTVDQWRARIRECRDGRLPAQSPIRISQAVLEPVLKAALESDARSAVRFGWAFESYVEDESGITARVRQSDGSQEHLIRARYLVGCDGAGSTVRRCADIGLSGERGLRPSYSISFRSEARHLLQRWGIGWHQRAHVTSIVAQNDEDIWTFHYRLAPDEKPPEDHSSILRAAFGEDVASEIITANFWVANLLVADRYRSGRVFLAGDAAHQVVPTGAYGMNSGIADAVDVAWKLAAVLQRWGGDRLLESYDAERRPVGLRNRDMAGTHAKTRLKIRALYGEAGDLEGDDASAEERRRMLAAQLAAVGNLENECFGVEYGYCYADSPVVCHEGRDPPPLAPAVYEPSTWPGSRLPSVALAGGVPLHDRLGSGFTLLAFGNTDVGNAAETATALRIPFEVLRIDDPEIYPVYERKLVLVRPDHHVAWRGVAHPQSWASVMRQVCGLAADDHARERSSAEQDTVAS